MKFNVENNLYYILENKIHWKVETSVWSNIHLKVMNFHEFRYNNILLPTSLSTYKY